MDGKIKPTDQEIQETMSKVSKMISDIQLETLSTVPLWMRMNYILRQIGTGIENGMSTLLIQIIRMMQTWLR